MIKPLTLTKLKKQLATLKKDELIELICKNYPHDEKLNDALNLRFLGPEYEEIILTRYLNKMEQIFYYTVDKWRIRDLQKLTKEYKATEPSNGCLIVFEIRHFFAGMYFLDNCYSKNPGATLNQMKKIFDDIVVRMIKENDPLFFLNTYENLANIIMTTETFNTETENFFKKKYYKLLDYYADLLEKEYPKNK